MKFFPQFCRLNYHLFRSIVYFGLIYTFEFPYAYLHFDLNSSLYFLQQRNNQKAVESYADQSLGMNTGSAPALMFSANFDEKKIPISPATPGNTQHPVESDLSAATALTNKAMASPVAPLQQNYFPPVRSGSMAAQLPLRLRSDVDHTASQPQTQLCITRSCTSNETAASSKLKEQELTIENGTINISTAYSQG